MDVLPDRIYQEAKITYTVKNDPDKEEIVVKGFAIYHKGLKDAQMKRLVRLKGSLEKEPHFDDNTGLMFSGIFPS